VATILYVVDDPAAVLLLDEMLRRAGHEPIAARGVAEALQRAARGDIDLIIAEHQPPGASALELLGHLADNGRSIPVIVLTADACIEHAAAAMAAGAAGYVTTPVRPRALELAVGQALEMLRLRRENDALRRELMAARAGHAETNGAIVLHSLNIDEAERVLIRHALVATANNRTKAAVLLGMSVRTLRNKLNGHRRVVSPDRG
jgi:DNA-binding NtrC family response regulator